MDDLTLSDGAGVADADQVTRRVADWIDRLGALRAQMMDWLAGDPGLAAIDTVTLAPARMDEAPMRQAGVAAVDMPAFELRAGARRVMRFLPKGLWIIGANGRVDLVTKSAAPILVDRAEPLAPANWQLYYPGATSRSVKLTADSFRELVRAGLP